MKIVLHFTFSTMNSSPSFLHSRDHWLCIPMLTHRLLNTSTSIPKKNPEISIILLFFNEKFKLHVPVDFLFKINVRNHSAAKYIIIFQVALHPTYSFVLNHILNILHANSSPKKFAGIYSLTFYNQISGDTVS